VRQELEARWLKVRWLKVRAGGAWADGQVTAVRPDEKAGVIRGAVSPRGQVGHA
jgi:hypothetical protein